MTECHHNERQEQGANRLLAAFVVTTVFMVVEAVGGFLSGSLALLADAAHMLTDSLALGLAASAHFIAGRPADAKRHFGYRRAQVLAAFVNGIFLSGLLIWIVWEAVRRFSNPVEIDAVPMLIIAAMGLCANAVAFSILHNAGSRDMNIRGATLHVVGDLFGSIAAIIAASVIMIWDWTRIDPLLSIFVAVLIARSAFGLVRDAGHILLEGAPENIDVVALVEGVREAAPEVKDVHNVRIWQLTPDHSSLMLHARVNAAGDAERALDRIKTFLDERYGIRQSTIQIEVGDACPDASEDEFLRATVRPSAANGAAHRTHAHAPGAHGAAALVTHK